MSAPSEKDLLNSSDDQELQDKTYNMPTNLQESLEVLDSDSDLISSLTELTSYRDLLDRIDQHLNKTEAELMTVVKFSSLILESEKSHENVKVKQLMGILDAVRDLRKRYKCNLQFIQDDDYSS